MLISVGSGTVADIGKAVSRRCRQLPHVVVQTAASVNGFADDQSVLLVDGVKRTTATRWPDRLVIDTDVLSLAPPSLNRAGLGDLMATFTAPADWLLASFVGQDDSLFAGRRRARPQRTSTRCSTRRRASAPAIRRRSRRSRRR